MGEDPGLQNLSLVSPTLDEKTTNTQINSAQLPLNLRKFYSENHVYFPRDICECMIHTLCFLLGAAVYR